MTGLTEAKVRFAFMQVNLIFFILISLEEIALLILPHKAFWLSSFALTASASAIHYISNRHATRIERIHGD